MAFNFGNSHADLGDDYQGYLSNHQTWMGGLSQVDQIRARHAGFGTPYKENVWQEKKGLPSMTGGTGYTSFDNKYGAASSPATKAINTTNAPPPTVTSTRRPPAPTPTSTPTQAPPQTNQAAAGQVKPDLQASQDAYSQQLYSPTTAAGSPSGGGSSWSQTPSLGGSYADYQKNYESWYGGLSDVDRIKANHAGYGTAFTPEQWAHWRSIEAGPNMNSPEGTGYSDWDNKYGPPPAAPETHTAPDGYLAPQPVPGQPPVTTPPPFEHPPSTNPETYAGSGIGPMEGSVLTRDHLAYLMSQDSPYMQHAAFQGAQTAAQRGLLNSSLAAGHAQRAAIDAALPIAQDDAAFYKNLGLTRDEYRLRGDLMQDEYGLKNDLMRDEFGLKTDLQQHEWDNRNFQNQNDWLWKGAFQDHESDTARWSKFMDGLININMQDMDPVQKKEALENFRADMNNSSVAPLMSRVQINDDGTVTFNPASGGSAGGAPDGPGGATSGGFLRRIIDNALERLPAIPVDGGGNTQDLPSAEELGIGNLVTDDRSVGDLVSTVEGTLSWVNHNVQPEIFYQGTEEDLIESIRSTPRMRLSEPKIQARVKDLTAVDGSLLKDKAHRQAYDQMIMDRLHDSGIEMTWDQLRKVAQHLRSQ